MSLPLDPQPANNPAVGSVHFHVGLAPYRAADGLMHGSFQALDDSGRYALATVEFIGQTIVRYYALHTVNVREFLTLARRAMGGAS